MTSQDLPVTCKDQKVKLTIEVELDPRDLVMIMGEVELSEKPGIREIRAAVKDIIVTTGIKHLLFQARKRSYKAEMDANTTDPGARKERSEHILWCRKLVDRAFKPRRKTTKRKDTSISLFDLDL
jgi:hypothetical protein